MKEEESRTVLAVTPIWCKAVNSFSFSFLQLWSVEGEMCLLEAVLKTTEMMTLL